MAKFKHRARLEGNLTRGMVLPTYRVCSESGVIVVFGPLCYFYPKEGETFSPPDIYCQFLDDLLSAVRPFLVKVR